MTVWSYLSWAVPPLPALPSFLNLSLPPNLQKRFVSYLLKRSLGRFVKGGGLDVERVEGQISQGRLVLEKLELDVDAVNEVLSSDIPLTVRSGQINGTLVQIPIRNLWSDSLILEISSISLEITITSSSSHSPRPHPTHSHIHDLAVSATSVAQEFLSSEVDAYEGADLARSIRQSLILSPKTRDMHFDEDVSDPFVSPQSMESEKVAPGGFPFSSGTTAGGVGSVPNSSVLAGLVERVLARLQVRVGEINVRMHFQDNERVAGATWFDFKVDHITYMNEMDDKETTDETEGSSTSRVIRWATVSLQMTEEVLQDPAADKANESEPRRDRRRSDSRTPTQSTSSLRTLSPKQSKQDVRSDSDSSTSDSDIDPAADMMMSQAIADLRDSQVLPRLDVIPDMNFEEEVAPDPMAASTTNSGEDEASESLYASAMEGTITGGELNASSFPARIATPLAVSNNSPGFGRIVAPADMTLSASVPEIPGRPPSSPKYRTSFLFAISQESSIRMSNGKQTSIQVHVGLCAGLVVPWQIRTLLNVARAFSTGSDMPADEAEEDAVETSPPISIKVKMPETVVAVAQTLDGQGDAASSWVWQPCQSPGMDIIRLHVIGFEALMDTLEPSDISNDSPHVSLDVANISVDEVLSSPPKSSQTTRILSFGQPCYAHSKEESVQSSTTDHATRQLWSLEDWPRIPCQELLPDSNRAETSPQTTDWALKVSYLRSNNRWNIESTSCMVCVDVSLMDRLQPLLLVLQDADLGSSAVFPESAQPRAVKTRPVGKATTASQREALKSTTPRLIDFHCPSFRLVLRWPTRHQIDPVACTALTHLRFSNASEEGVLVGGAFDQMLVMICPTNGTDCQTILAISSLKVDQDESSPFPKALVPHFFLGSSTAVGLNCELQVPSLQCNLDKACVDALQYFVDDLSSWAARRQDSSSTRGDSTSTSGSEQNPGPITVRFRVTEVDVFMRAPDTTPDKTCKRLVCSLSDSDMTITMGGKYNVRTMGIALSIDNATVAHCQGEERTALLYRQARQSPMSPSTPAILARFTSFEDQLSFRKETGINCELASMAVVATPSSRWMSDLACLFKSPPGIFENVEPSEITKLSITLKDTLAVLPANQVLGALLIRVDGFSATTELVANADQNTYNIASDSVELFASDLPLKPLREILDRLHVVNAVGDSAVDVCSVMALKDVALRVSMSPQNRMAGNHIVLDVGTVGVAACADAIASLEGLVEDIASFWAGSPDPLEQSSIRNSPLTKGLDLLASLDEAAFTKHAPVLSDAEVISDDIPTNEIYLKKYDSGGQARRQESTTSPEKYGGELPQPAASTNEHDSSRVRILYQGPIRLSPGYWAKQWPLSKPNERLQLSLDIKIDEVQVLLHDGYDWSTTRKTIEAEIKTIRRRLQKFRQILASGQTPDESVEVTRTWLYESILIGLPEEELGDDAEALIAAIDNQLEHLDADIASIAPSGPATSRRGDSTRSSPRPAKRRRKLERSSRPQIEIKLRGLQVLHRVAIAGVRDRAKTIINSANLEILDHIKTSTWKKFLAPMALARGQVAEADVKMVQVLLTKVIAEQHDKQQEEYRLKVEVQPLRLHIDQDALDFIKRFFAFQNRVTPVNSPPLGPSKQNAYLQHVEILPVHIKMDYKPKRVSVRALRAGKTMELMNFFHFDGSEMTLRRVLLSGVTGWSTLYDALNDIWAPDVKSNQLSDVLAGVTPLRSVVTVGSGVADLILLPIENYRQDGRISRGLQKGAKSFAMSTALEALRLGANLATGTQVILEKAEHALGGKFEEAFPEGDFADLGGDGEQSIMVAPTSKYAQQPESFKEGLSAAYQSLSSNFTQAAQTILAVPMEVHERSENGTVRAVVRAIPVAFLKSGIGATEAVSKALFGMRNQLDPSVTAELSDKYK